MSYPGNYGGGNASSPYIQNQAYYDTYSGGGGSSAAPKFGNEKMEEELSQHIKKATSNEESAPKQKHVRGCILYTWDLKSSGSFWFVLKTQPIIGDDVMSWKTLITAHKVVREGHNSVLQDAIRERSWFEQLARNTLNSRGYGVLIKAYVQFLQAKMDYHQQHPAFRANFDYEEYVSLRGVEDPNEGYTTIEELIILLDKLDAFQKLIFNNLHGFNAAECKIAALVPLVEESYGIYQFLMSMLTAMHMNGAVETITIIKYSHPPKVIGSVEVMAPLRDKFNQGHYALFSFYYNCSQLKYLTSLISIPKLTQSPPDFLANGPPTLQPKEKKKTDFDEDRYLQELEFQRYEKEKEERDRAERERAARQHQLDMQKQQEYEMQQAELQRQIEMNRQQELLRQQEEERMRLAYLQQQNAAVQQMEHNILQQQYLDLTREYDNLRSQAFRDKSVIDEASLKMRALENQLNQMSLTVREGTEGKDIQIRKLEEELAQWKKKYEALAKLYAQLRKEHLDLLTKLKDAKDSGGKVTEEARKEVDAIKAEMKIKANEVTNLLIEKERLRGEVDRLKQQYEDELKRLQHELQDTQASLLDLSKSKGAEVASVVDRFNSEKQEMERQKKANLQMIDELRAKLQDALDEHRRLKASKDEDDAVLQAGLDQTLLALANLQKNAAETEANLMAQLKKIQGDQVGQLNRMMDNILQSCIMKINDALFELESPTHEGNQTASPEYVLSLLEKSQSTCGEFGSSLIRMIQGGDQSEAITTSNAFAHSIAQLLHNAKGVSRLAGSDEIVDGIIKSVRDGANSGKNMFEKVKVSSLAAVDQAKRPEHVIALTSQTQSTLSRMGGVFESLVTSKIGTATDDLADAVEKGLQDAARAIEEAAKRLEALMNRPKTKDLQVHESILSAALAITTAISNLIKCASASQQEIVAHGKGTSTKGAFYKKNNKWSEGLISAAKAVAMATTFLVEGADGLVNGTHSMEQLVVAANEVGVATTQLVAASRVKAIPFSKTQDKLEEAAVAVREATKLLVKAAKAAAQASSESQIQDEIKKMGSHQFKVVEMEQQVRILELEKELSNARYKLAGIRKSGYSE